jgi:hypothetical protein
MPFVDGRTIPEVLMRPGIHGRFLAHKDLGASTVSLLMNRADPGAAVPLHIRMKRPTESDFEINVIGAGVEAIFKPTKSHYSYNRLVDERDIARFGPISPARVRHAGPTGDTADYDSADVEAMALRLVSAAVRRR